jgi:hypothetical protein
MRKATTGATAIGRNAMSESCLCFCYLYVYYVVLFLFGLLLCYYVSVISIFKFAFIVFDEKPQRCLNAMKNALRKDLMGAAANHYLFFSIQQLNHSCVVSLTIFENPYS